MVYTPPNAIEVDFELLEYTAPNSDESDFIRNEGGTLVSGAGHQTSRAFAPIITSDTDFLLAAYTPPDPDSVDFSYVFGVLGKAYQVSYHTSQVAQVTPVIGNGYQTSYPTEELVVRVPGWLTQQDYIEIVVDGSLIEDDLYNYPLRIRIGGSCGKTGCDVAYLVFLRLLENRFKFEIHPNYYGIPCYVEIEDWEYEDNWAELHVKVPYILNGVDLKLRMYFDALHADNTDYVGDTGSTAARAVWDDDHKEVYHLNGFYRGITGEVKDSSVNARHLTDGPSPFLTEQVVDNAGGYGQEFGPAGDIITGSGYDLQGDYEATFEITTRPNTADANYTYYPLEIYAPGRSYAVACFAITTAFNLYVKLWTSGGGFGLTFAGLAPNNVLLHAVLIFNGNESSIVVVVNGVVVYNGTNAAYSGYICNTSYPTDPVTGINFGQDHTYPDYPNYRGITGETRVSSIARSIGWAKASYHGTIDDLLTYSKYTGPLQEVWGGGHQTSYTTSLFIDWNADSYIDITIDHTKVLEDLYDFPVRIRIADDVGITDFDLRWIFDRLGGNKYKIAAQALSNGQNCYIEIEDWEYLDDWAELHCKVPVISSEYDTVIRLYFDPEHDDNTDYVGVSGSTSGQAVWDNEFMGVYHLNGEYNGTLDECKDSTSNENHLTLYKDLYTYLTRVKLLNGYCQYFPPYVGGYGYDYVFLRGNLPVTVDITALTLETYGIFHEEYPGETYTHFAYLTDVYDATLEIARDCDPYNEPPDYDRVVAIINDYTHLEIIAETPPILNVPLYLVTSIEEYGYLRVYKNGVFLQESESIIGTINTSAYLAIGGQGNELSYDMHVDEVRVSDVQRSDAWIKASEHCLTDDFVTYTMPLRERHGEGHQVSYYTSEIFANSTIGKGYQTSYFDIVGLVVQIQPVVISGHQTTYSTGEVGVKVPQKEPVDGDGYQTSYHTSHVVQIQNIVCSGHQTSYAAGSVVQIQDIACSGHQTSYFCWLYYAFSIDLEAIIHAERYEAIIESNIYEVEEV